MRELRRMIRKLILENANHYQKLITMFASKDLVNIRQAVELGVTLGYFEKIAEENGNPTWWICDLEADEGFYDMYVEQYPEGISVYEGGESNVYGTNEIGYIHIVGEAGRHSMRISWPKEPLKEGRRILSENDAHYNKIADLICSEKLENIQQALELAEGMGYIDGYTYKEETHYASRSHGWTVLEGNYDEEFVNVLADRIKEKTLFRRPGGEGILFVAPFHNKAYSDNVSGSFSIRLIQKPPYK